MNAIIALSITSVLLLIAGAFGMHKIVKPLALLGILAALIVNLLDFGVPHSWFGGMMLSDKVAVVLNSLMILCAGAVVIIPYDSSIGEGRNDNVTAILLLATAGGLCMTLFGNLAILFLGIEILSISLYILAGSAQASPSSNEAAMKYFLMGSFATGFLLFGIALIYGATGSFYIDKIASISLSWQQTSYMYLAGLLLLFIGIAFKISAAPFHFWTPDVYEGAPASYTAFMASAGKVAAIAVLIKLVIAFHNPTMASLAGIFLILSVLSVLIGNFTALYQQNMQRLMAYSGIAHIGYLLMMFSVKSPIDPKIAVYYTIAYAMATLVVLIVHSLVKNTSNRSDINAYAGFGTANPIAALALTVSLLSLTGIPPLAGFMGKYLVFVQAAKGGFIWLVVFGVIASAVSIGYYFKPIIETWLKSADDPVKISTSWYINLMLIVFTLAILFVGCWPSLLLSLIP